MNGMIIQNNWYGRKFKGLFARKEKMKVGKIVWTAKDLALRKKHLKKSLKVVP